MTSTSLVPDVASYTVRNLVTRMVELAGTHGDRVAVIDADRTTTYAELWRDAYEYLARHQPAEQTLMPVLARPYAATLATMLGIWLGGGIPLPLPATTPAKSLERILRRTDRRPHDCQPWRAHLHTPPGQQQLYLVGGEPPTSPRLGQALGLQAAGVAVLAAPLHVGAVVDVAVRHLLTGGTLALPHRFSPTDWLATVVETGADWALLAPGQIRALLDYHQSTPGWLTIATRTLDRIVVPATAPADNLEHLAALAAATGATIKAWYHTPIHDGALSTTAYPYPLRPLPGIRLRVVDPAGEPAPLGVSGLIEGASTTGATAHRADTPCTPPSQWRTVGDVGALDEHGNLTLHSLQPASQYRDPDDRPVTAAALRRVLAEHPAATAATVHIGPDRYGQRRARVHLWTSTPVAAADVAAHCHAHGTAVPASQITVHTQPAQPGQRS